MTETNVSKNSDLESTNVTLLEQVRNNEGVAWEILVELYAPMIYSRCRHHWGLEPADAENVGQEVFKSIARSISSFRRKREGSFRKWLRVIIDNQCKDHFRKDNLAVAAGGTKAQVVIEAVADNIDNEPLSDSQTEVGEKAILMRQAMKMVQDEFSTRDWKIFWDIAIEDKDRQDTAEKYEVTDNVVYLAISRIRKRLKIVFEDLLDDDIYPKSECD